MGETSEPESISSRRRVFRIVRLVTIGLALPLLLVPTGIGLVGMWGIVHPGCSDSGRTPAAPYREISIPSRSGGVYRGFYIPGKGDSFRNNGTIIVPPAYSGGRDGMLYEAAGLSAAGYNVLTYESRVCAGKNVLSLGYRDVEDVGDVLAFLEHNSDDIQVDMTRVALHGFSSAGAASLMSAAAYPQQVRAVLAEGGYHNLNEYMGIGKAKNFLESLLQFGLRVAYRLATGDDSSVLDPAGVVVKIPPRPVFLVYGSKEISLEGALEMLNSIRTAAPDTMAALWIVPGADHGGYIGAVGESEYTRQVLTFYDCALMAQCAQWDAAWKKP